MTATHRRRRAISRQRFTSTHHNSMEDQQDRMVIDLIRGSCGDDLPKSGIVVGCTATVVVGTMNMSVNTGWGLQYDGTSTLPDSKYQVIEVPEAGLITTLDVGGALGRWDLIMIKAAAVAGAVEVTDFWDPAFGTFVSQNASPQQEPEPEILVVKGAESASPKFPAPTAGYIPLAIQYVGGGVTKLDADSTIFCRPILRPSGESFDPEAMLDVSSGHVVGGGVEVSGNSLTGTLAATMEGYFGRSSTPWRIEKGTDIKLSFGLWDGGSFPVASTVVYFYAIPAPLSIPFGETYAQREFWIADVSNIQSDGFKDGMSGCIVVASANPPSLDVQGSPGSGTASFIGHPTYDSFTSSRADWVYIGAAYYDSGIGLMCSQTVRGDRVSPVRKPGEEILSLFPIGFATSIQITSEVSGEDPIRYPATCFDVLLRFGVYTPILGDVKIDFHDGDTNTTYSNESRQLVDFVGNNGFAFASQAQEWVVQPFGAGVDNITINYADESGGVAGVVVRCQSYRDQVLARR